MIRAVSALLDQEWITTYIDLCVYGIAMCDLPSANSVWGRYLKERGYKRHVIPDICPACYTVKDFATDHPQGAFLLALNGHVVTVIDGNYLDTWDSGDETPSYYWKKG